MLAGRKACETKLGLAGFKESSIALRSLQGLRFLRSRYLNAELQQKERRKENENDKSKNDKNNVNDNGKRRKRRSQYRKVAESKSVKLC